MMLGEEQMIGRQGPVEVGQLEPFGVGTKIDKWNVIDSYAETDRNWGRCLRFHCNNFLDANK